MKLCVISLGGYSSRLIAEEAMKFFSSVEQFKISEMEVRAGKSSLKVLHKGAELPHFDCVLLRGSYKYAVLQRAITEALHGKSYMPAQPQAFSLGHDKLLTILELQKYGINIPKTYLASTINVAKKILDDVEFPIIIKIPGGTQGKGVMSADSIASAKTILDVLEVFKQPYIIQEYIETGVEDIRAIVVGDKVVACMKRKGMVGEVRANIHQGGKGSGHRITIEENELAIRTAKAIKADIVGVDILESFRGPMVIEANLSPGLRGIMNATKNNIAKDIAEYLFLKTRELKEGRKDEGAKTAIRELDKKHERGVLMNLDVRLDTIRIPPEITKITGFNRDREVLLIADRGKLIIRKAEDF